jgi:hypothetical protein
MELAKLFATVGFKVDKDGLTEFRKEMADLKVSLKEAAIQTGNLKNQLRGLSAQFRAFQKMTDTKGVTKWMDGIEKSVVHLNNMQTAVSGQAERSKHWADSFASSIFKLHQAITGRENEVVKYANAIGLLAINFERLKAATAGISRFLKFPPVLSVTRVLAMVGLEQGQEGHRVAGVAGVVEEVAVPTSTQGIGGEHLVLPRPALLRSCGPCSLQVWGCLMLLLVDMPSRNWLPRVVK